MTSVVAGSIRWDKLPPLWFPIIVTTVFFGCFYCEYNRSVKWDMQGIRQRWRGAGYFIWHVDDDYIRMADIISVTTDRNTTRWRSTKIFMNLCFNTADTAMYVNPAYFRRESVEELLGYIHEAHPHVVFDEDAAEYRDGGFLNSFPYKYSTTFKLVREGKYDGYKES